ncbi:hypothetical protein BVC80_1837g252 [Macleaya cordata]|uniref:Uncharacterized protein n=1 Tax=Macleaya cordata TaxID=56857 RepID=A0A200R413_MACCD|nr:hypothetical protein BVC80_1837g252 [Macleaya cordata]
MGTVKTEDSSCLQLQPTSSSALISESNVTASTKLEKNTGSLSSLNFQALKFDEDVDEVQSPDSSIWDSLFTNDQIDSIADFMISSPLRTPDYMISSPKRIIPGGQQNSGHNNQINYNYLQTLEMQNLLAGCSSDSPSSCISSQLGGSPNYTTIQNRGKSQSPLHKVLNNSASPTNSNQFLQPESLALPAMEGFVDDYHKNGFGDYPAVVMNNNIGCGSSGRFADEYESRSREFVSSVEFFYNTATPTATAAALPTTTTTTTTEP